MDPTVIAPPPWFLTGNGLALLYHIPASFNREYGFMADYQRQGYIGVVGAVILADYKTSGVGPYRELLYIPGLFRLRGKLTFSVSKIFVSTNESVRNGRQNWGIPKELADFRLEELADGMQLYRVSRLGKLFFEARVKPWGARLPFSSKLIPLIRLTQQFQDHLLRTRPAASGSVCLASLQHLAADPAYFPPVHLLRPFLALSIPALRMVFPVAEEL